MVSENEGLRFLSHISKSAKSWKTVYEYAKNKENF